MSTWSPFRAEDSRRSRDRAAPRTRGRRRQRLLAPPDDPDAVLTDRDAARTAEAARQARTAPVAPAWERFSSGPVSSSRAQHEVDDEILRLAQAQCTVCGPVVPADTRRRDQLLRAAGARRDYGTGPAYQPGSMR